MKEIVYNSIIAGMPVTVIGLLKDDRPINE